MNARKWLALLMSLVLLAGILPGAALAADGDTAEPTEETAAPDATGTPTEGVTDSAAADAQAAIDEAQAQYAKIEAQLDAASKKYDADAVVATVNGTEVTWRLCYYLIGSLTSQYINYTMAIPDFTTDVGDGTTLQDAMREAIEARMKYYTVPAAEAEKRGLSETVEAEVEEQWQSMVEQFGSLDALMEAIESAYLDEPSYRLLLRSNAAFNAIMESTYGAAGEKLSDEDVLAWANDNNYLHCKHILFLTKNDDGTDMTDEEKAEVRKEAETTLEELRALESDREKLLERFDALMADADDPGMTTFPDGYTFGDGQMVQEFEDGTRALEEYALSDIVESSYGYHIILRLPLDPDGATLSQNSGTGEYMTLRADAANELFNAMLLDWIETAEVEWKDDFGTMDYNELFAVPEDAQPETEPEKETKTSKTWMYIAIAAIVVVIALAAVLVGKKKTVTEAPAEPEKPETAEEAPETPAEPEAAEEPAAETPAEPETTEAPAAETPAEPSAEESAEEEKKEEDE